MTWTPLVDRRDGLPLLLAGPILRRVTSQSVTVWYASKLWRNCRLRVLNADGSLRFQSARFEPVSLGSFLHIGCVTARASAGQDLRDGEFYSYDLDFDGMDLNAALAGTAYQITLGYSGSPLPSFRLPASQIADLRFAVGSCRKPHGGGRDALEALDQVLQPTPSTEPRPQLLVLCGDQIYADDVADALLHSLMDAVGALMDDWDEQVPSLGASSTLRPGQRTAALESLGFTGMKPKPENAKSHLLTLGEYITMYLFAWSDVLWPSEFADFATATGQPAQTIRVVPKVGAIPVDARGLGRFREELVALEGFRSALPAVRRVLANIPTYMVFDDHEISDDWYIDRKWCEDTLGNDGARRVLANGLSAYALCQAWGNDPEQFEDANGNGRKLLAAVSTWAISQGTGDHEPVSAGLLPPTDDALVGADDPVSHQILASPSARVRWHFTIDFPQFRLTVLDTRTQRQFPGATDFPILIARQALHEQLGDAIAPLTMVVLAPPFVGPKVIERFQRSQVTLDDRLDWDCEAPALQPVFFERFLAELAMRAPVDPTAPGRRHATLLLLSGDVHYSCAATIDYESALALEELGPVPATTLRIVQLTSSALKNEDAGNFSLTFLGNPSFGGPPAVTTHGYNDAATAQNSVTQALRALVLANPRVAWPRPPIERLEGTSAACVDISPLPEAVRSLLTVPQWQHEVRFIVDQRNPSDRGPGGGAVTLFGTEVVGHSCIGDVRFDGGLLRFDVWWQPTHESQFRTATRYLTRLDAVPDALTLFRTAVANEALVQLQRWRRLDGTQVLETESEGLAILENEYWPHILGMSPDDWFAAPDWWNVAWSAAFVIYCVNTVARRRGLADMLESDPHHPEHMYYAWRACRNRTTGVAPRYWTYQPTEPVEVGDIVVKSRGAVDATWAEIQSAGYVDRDTHGDIVVDVQGANARIVGGNVDDSVKDGTYSLIDGCIDTSSTTNDADRVFAVLKPRLTA